MLLKFPNILFYGYVTLQVLATSKNNGKLVMSRKNIVDIYSQYCLRLREGGILQNSKSNYSKSALFRGKGPDKLFSLKRIQARNFGKQKLYSK